MMKRISAVAQVRCPTTICQSLTGVPIRRGKNARYGKISHMKKNYRFAQVVSLVVIILLANGLSVRSQQNDKPESSGEVRLTPLPLTRFDEIEDKNKIFHPRGGSVDWGLALSGGGIRSGSYSIGVMKALYDIGLFENLDAISTVSGGGYAAYWLYGLYDPSDENLKFGDSAFGKKSFLVNTCKLQNVANMYSFGKMFKSFFRSRAGAFDDYRKAIHRTFGLENDALNKRTIDFYRNAVKDGGAPYFFCQRIHVFTGAGRCCKSHRDHAGAYRKSGAWL